MTGSGIASRQLFDVDAYLQSLHQEAANHQTRPITHQETSGVVSYRGPAAFSDEWLHALLATCASAASSPQTARVIEGSPVHVGDLLCTCVFWKTPGGGARVAVGACLDMPISAPDRFEQVRRILANYPTSLSLGTDSEAGRPAEWFIGGAFSANGRSTPWQEWPDARVLLPRFVFEQTADGQTSVTCHMLTNSDADIEAQWERLDIDLRACAEAVVQRQRVAGNRLREEERGRYADTAPTSDAPEPLTQRSVAQGAQPGTARGAQAFLHAVVDTAADIRSGMYEKAVLARSDVVELPAQTGIQHVVQRLEVQYPDTFVYAVRTGDSWFVGASPERLVRVTDGQAAIDCLAGTTGRGDTLAADDQLGSQLLASAKDRQEHQVVVRWVTEQLADLLVDLDLPERPQLKKLQNVQHLWTEVNGQVRPGVSAVDLMARLHPTPAVAGVPRDTALQVIAQREPMDRGWYAGPIGWADDCGGGEFAVALRSALFTDDQVHLYAGVGIMGDSDPEAEWQETALKLQAMRTAIVPQNTRQATPEKRGDSHD